MLCKKLLSVFLRMCVYVQGVLPWHRGSPKGQITVTATE